MSLAARLRTAALVTTAALVLVTATPSIGVSTRVDGVGRWSVTTGAATVGSAGAEVRAGARTSAVTLTASPRASTRPGLAVAVVGEVSVDRVGLPVVVALREVGRTGRVVQTVEARRTSSGTGFQSYGGELTVRGAGSRVEVVVTLRDVARRDVRLRSFALRTGATSTALAVHPGPATRWFDEHPDDPRADVIGSRIAPFAVSTWLLGEEDPYERLAASVATAQRGFQTSVVTPYYIPRRWDGLSDEAGAPSLADYRGFTDRVADAIGSAPTVVVLEPDALWFYTQMKRQIDATGEYRENGQWYRRSDLTVRRDSLRYAVETYSALPRTTVYVEAGTASGVVEPAEMAAALAEVGVGTSRRVGFAVNVSSYAPEPAITAWADSLRAELRARGRDARYVVDTGRNGNPAWTGRANDDDPMPWCNPTGQRLGLPPGPASAAQRAHGRDWNLWVKGPGESDGDCGVGPGTFGGQFMPDVAAGMVG